MVADLEKFTGVEARRIQLTRALPGAGDLRER
jgi:hypothetical protein